MIEEKHVLLDYCSKLAILHINNLYLTVANGNFALTFVCSTDGWLAIR